MRQVSKKIKTVIKLLVFRLIIGGIVVGYMPYSILSSHPTSATLGLNVFTILGGLFLVTGAVIYLRSVWDFAFTGASDNPNFIVESGTYDLVRNPMYISLVVILLGECVLFQSVVILGYWLGFWLCVHLLVIFYEERMLAKKFGAGYKDYCSHVPRWIPNFKSHNNRGV